MRPIRTLPPVVAVATILTLFVGSAAVHAAPPPSGTTQLVDVSATPGVASTDNERSDFQPSVSADGRYVVFSSRSQDIVSPRPAERDDFEQIYLRDTVSNTTRVISAAGGVVGDHQSLHPKISDDGSVVMYLTAATNIVPGVLPTRPQVVAWSLSTGLTRLVSAGWESPTQPVNDRITSFDLSGNGSTIVYATAATDVLPGDPYVVPRTRVYKVDAAGETTHVAYDPVLSADKPSVSDDGRFVAFVSRDAHTAIGTAGVQQVYVRDTALSTTDLISADSALTRSSDADAGEPTISGDGRSVAFSGSATNLVPEFAHGSYIYVRDRGAGRIAIESRNSAGGLVQATNPTLSSNGVAIAYSSGGQVHVRSRATGATGILSVSRSVDPGNGPSFSPMVSADGRYVVWSTSATNLTPDRYPRSVVFGSSGHTMIRNIGTSYAG
ncbi:hypothetical protein ACEXQD_16775 [Herbiconiux sp. P15]|uniref:TolB family protein n=1 Tax=Herbiconiux liukaitaii TaxID=3342799 RepID=UPI0035BB42FE